MEHTSVFTYQTCTLEYQDSPELGSILHNKPTLWYLFVTSIAKSEDFVVFGGRHMHQYGQTSPRCFASRQFAALYCVGSSLYEMLWCHLKVRGNEDFRPEYAHEIILGKEISYRESRCFRIDGKYIWWVARQTQTLDAIAKPPLVFCTNYSNRSDTCGVCLSTYCRLSR